MSLLLVNDHGHASLTMLSLRAIQPHRCCAVNQHCICRCRCAGGGYRHETRVDTGDVGVLCDRLAGSIEGGLCDGVVVGCKLELDHIADGGLDVVG